MGRNDRRDFIGVNFANIGEARVRALLETESQGGWSAEQIHEARTWLNEQEVVRSRGVSVRSWIAIVLSALALLVSIGSAVRGH